MAERARDQMPEAWSAGADGYAEQFAPFTAPYADAVVDRLGVDGLRVLDVAAGTGVVALAAAARGARVTAVDFAPGMVAALTARSAALGLDVECAVMDGTALELEDASFDVAVSMFGLMFFPDIDAGLRELHRVVRPGGRVAIGVWDLGGFPLIDLVGAAIDAVVPGRPPAPTPTWARLADETGLVDALHGAGFVDVAVEPIAVAWRFDDPIAFFRALPTWSPPVQPLFDAAPPELLDRAAVVFADAVAARDQGDGLSTRALVGYGARP